MDDLMLPSRAKRALNPHRNAQWGHRIDSSKKSEQLDKRKRIKEGDLLKRKRVPRKNVKDEED